MANPAFFSLFDKYLLGTISPDELRELQGYIQIEENQAILDELLEQAFANKTLAIVGDDDPREMYKAFLDRIHGAELKRQEEAATRKTPVIVLRPRPWYFRIAAAAVLVLLGTGVWWLMRERHPAATTQTAVAMDVAAPAKSRATLTLASGQKLILDSTSSGTLAEQGNAQVVKQANSQLAYQMRTAGAGALTHEIVLYNTLTNPRGSGVVTLTLSDGTKVWLNAESSIRYPVLFTAGERTVEMTGEAYYEVAKDAGKPFHVTAAGETIDVLGTSFNVNAYPDEAIAKTTLLEGSIAVDPKDVKRRFILKPGQQAWISSEKPTRKGAVPAAAIYSGADADEVLAWKNGLFAFSGDADLPTVMRQLARWYNIDVTYEGTIPKQQFGGKIGRTLSLSQVLDVLVKSGVRYRIEPGNKLIIGN